jgi:hypothetical protein
MNDFEFRTHLRTSEIEKNNFSNMQLLKSIYDDSFDIANEFFHSGFEGFKKNTKKEVIATAKKVESAKKKADAAKKKVDEANKKVEDAKKQVEDAKENAEEAKDDVAEAKDDANDAEESAAAAEDDAAAETEDADGADEEFANYSDSDSDNDDQQHLFEGFKKSSSKKKSSSSSSKKKSSSSSSSKSKYPETIPSPDLIGWAVKKANGTKNDEKMIKNILNSIFVTFISFLIAHNWYYNIFVNPTKFRFEESLSFLKENEFIHFFSIYVVQVVQSIETYIVENIPKKIESFMVTSNYGKRSVFFFILFASLSTVPYFLKQLQYIFEYLRTQLNRIIHIFNGPSDKIGTSLAKLLNDAASKIFDSIFAFKGNAFLSSIIGITFVVKYMGNVMVDHSKGIIENATEVIPSFFTKLLAGNIFYIIYLVFKFSIFYQPTIAFSSFIIAVYIFYFSIVRLFNVNGFSQSFSVIEENIKHMNDSRVLFGYDLLSKYKNNVEDALRFIMQNSHQIIFLIILKINIGNILNMNSIYLKTATIAVGIASALAILYSVLEKYGIGKSEVAELNKEFEELSQEIKGVADTPIKPNLNLFDKIYKPFKSV